MVASCGQVAAESSGEAPRVIGRPFPKGVSGNPGGKPKGLASRIREETANGAEMVAFVLDVFRDDTESTKMRLEAATWLADRAFGRPAMVAQLMIDEQRATLNDLLEMSKEELDGLRTLALSVLENAGAQKQLCPPTARY
jgi:hypothetical protein